MDRRDFMKRLTAGLAAIPFAGRLGQMTATEDVAQVVELPVETVPPTWGTRDEMGSLYSGTLLEYKVWKNVPLITFEE